MNRKYSLFARKVNPSKWQPNHVFIITGLGAFDYAKSLYDNGRYQPALPCPENISPELYRWPVSGMDVTIKNFGSTDEFTESLIYELLKAGAKLVVNVDHATGEVSVYRQEGLQDAA